MSVLVRRCAFRSFELIRKYNRSIEIRNCFGNIIINNDRGASTLCRRYTFVPPRRNDSTTASTNHMPIRFNYSKKGGKRTKNDHEDSDEDSDSDSELAKFNETGDKDKNLVRIKVQSMRLDNIIKSFLGSSRSKIEKIFYESKIRINGKKVAKKSVSVKSGDEVDVVKSFSPNNPENLVVSRIEVLSARADDKEEHIILIARRFKTLTVENYSGPDSYKASGSDE